VHTNVTFIFNIHIYTLFVRAATDKQTRGISRQLCGDRNYSLRSKNTAAAAVRVVFHVGRIGTTYVRTSRTPLNSPVRFRHGKCQLGNKAGWIQSSYAGVLGSCEEGQLHGRIKRKLSVGSYGDYFRNLLYVLWTQEWREGCQLTARCLGRLSVAKNHRM